MEQFFQLIEARRLVSDKYEASYRNEYKFQIFENQYKSESLGFIYESELPILFSYTGLKGIAKQEAPAIPIMLNNDNKKIIEGSVFSGFLMFDIDTKENDNIKEIYYSAIESPYTYFVSLSKSEGLSIIIKATILKELYSSVEGFKQAYTGLANEYFNIIGINANYDKGAMKRSQLRYVNFNSFSWLHHNLDSKILSYNKPLEQKEQHIISISNTSTIAQSQGLERWLLNYLTNEIINCSPCHSTVLKKSMFAGGYITGCNINESVVFNHILELYKRERPKRSLANMTNTIQQGIDKGKQQPIYNFKNVI